MLSYVFWHRPSESVDPQRYEDELRAFHESLATEPPAGYRGSAVLRTSPPWSGGEPAYEDWYLVDDFAALGVLNEAAVAAPHRALHDPVAGDSAHGAGGLYGLAAGEPSFGEAASSVWLSKPRGVTYRDFVRSLKAELPGATVWIRQLVLGPGLEFCIHGAGARAGLDALSVPAELLLYERSG